MNGRGLRHLITIDSRVENKDAAGGIDYSWVPFATVRAAIEPARVLKTFAAAQEQESYDTLIRIRYLPGVRSTMRVRLVRPENGVDSLTKVYEITGVRLSDEVRYELYLQCVERQSEGFRRG